MNFISCTKMYRKTATEQRLKIVLIINNIVIFLCVSTFSPVL